VKERLEDIIRRSAGEQRSRYRPSGDLGARVEARRRQRAARRLASAGVGVAAIVVVIGFAATRQLGESDLDVAASTTVARAATTSTTAPPPSSTMAPVVPATSPSEVTVSNTTTPPTAAPLNSATPAPYAAADGSVWPYGQFWNVPQLGAEARVRGTGCGSVGQLGDRLPDGLFAGYITGYDANHVAIDVACIYAVPDVASLPNPAATVVSAGADYVVVNNNTRSRTVPMDPAIELRVGIRDAGGECVDGRSTTQWTDIPSDRQVWMRIHDGRATWVLADCPPP
jgi:hypothetical protein